jgi:hypothetical protein
MVKTSEGETRWVAVASFGARYLAEVAIHQLENADIPVMVQGGEPGIWGPAHAGPTSRGIALLVPEGAVEHARELLGDAAGDQS